MWLDVALQREATHGSLRRDQPMDRSAKRCAIACRDRLSRETLEGVFPSRQLVPHGPEVRGGGAKFGGLGLADRDWCPLG